MLLIRRSNILTNKLLALVNFLHTQEQQQYLAVRIVIGKCQIVLLTVGHIRNYCRSKLKQFHSNKDVSFKSIYSGMISLNYEQLVNNETLQHEIKQNVSD